jgi:hypothetical protein
MSDAGSRFSRFSRQDTFSTENSLAEEVEGEEIDIDKEIAPIDYYGVLNVGQSSNELEIKNSYKKLCMTFHPDKQPEESKQFAEEKFHLIQRAYHGNHLIQKFSQTRTKGIFMICMEQMV